jgi:hypothetical protein
MLFCRALVLLRKTSQTIDRDTFMSQHFRIARPVSNLIRARSMYCAGLDLRVVGEFEDHAGFDGAMLGRADLGYHLEFTTCRTHPVQPNPTSEDLLVFYFPELTRWESMCAKMLSSGFVRVDSFNPYWDIRGQTFEDPDRYRVVLTNTRWVGIEQ